MICGCATSVRTMYASEKAMVAWRRYLAIARMIVTSRPLSLRSQDERVQAVVLQLAAPDGQERVLEEVPYAVEIVGHAAQSEVIDPHRVAAVGHNLVGALVHDLRAHVLERRHHV